uniref:RNA-dependent RNA polymerase n=1 Tax=Anisakis simplex TaxID=6269 RepID=A0A0M3K141_ANISI
LKTNRDMIMILKALNGSNNVDLLPSFKHRTPQFNDWSFRALGLFKDSKKNDNRTLNIGKGSTAAALSRPFVEFIVDKLNLTTLLQRFDTIQYGGDEYVIPSLNSEDALDAPGGYTMKCMHVDTSFVMRFILTHNFLKIDSMLQLMINAIGVKNHFPMHPIRVLNHDKKYAVENTRPCYSKRYRHGFCVFGIKDLKLLRGLRCLFGNKMVPEIDYGVISCWAKELHNRTYHQQNHTVDLNFYPNMRTVVFNKEKQKWRSNMKAFNCTG